MTTSQMIQDIKDSVAASADDLALQNGEITYEEYDRRQQERFWNSGKVGTN